MDHSSMEELFFEDPFYFEECRFRIEIELEDFVFLETYK